MYGQKWLLQRQLKKLGVSEEDLGTYRDELTEKFDEYRTSFQKTEDEFSKVMENLTDKEQVVAFIALFSQVIGDYDQDQRKIILGFLVQGFNYTRSGEESTSVS